MPDLNLSAVIGLPDGAVRYFDTIGSTNDAALEWLTAGAPELALVIADQQTSGRGRLGRKWITRPGSAVAASLILHPTDAESAHLPLFSPLAGLALCETLEEDYHLAPQIKWPNDVLLEGKKTCGILAEASWSGNKCQGLVIGIGINIARDSVPPDSEVLFPATCLEAHTSLVVERYALLAGWLKAFQRRRGQLGSPEFITAWKNRLAFLHREVKIVQSKGEEIVGTLENVLENGDLVLRDALDQNHYFQAGDVHLRPL